MTLRLGGEDGKGIGLVRINRQVARQNPHLEKSSEKPSDY